METVFHFLNIPELSVRQEHQFHFVSQATQLNYFLSKKVYSVESCYYQKENRRALQVEKSLESLVNANYIIYKNKGRWWFCFITDKHYINEDNTEIEFIIDNFQTYWFDFAFNPSFIDRCHENRNGNNTVDEDLELGDHYFKTRHNIWQSDNNNIVICSSTPLGKIKDTHSGGGTGGDIGTNEISAKAFSIMNRNMHYSQGRAGEEPVIPNKWIPPLPADSSLQDCGYGVDCSRLIQWSHECAGIDIPRTTYDQVHWGSHVDINSIQGGDAIYCHYNNAGQPEHVVMMISVQGADRFIYGHASTRNNPIEKQVYSITVTGKTPKQYLDETYTTYEVRRFR